MAHTFDFQSFEESIIKLPLLDQREWLRATLSCTGDAVVTADVGGGVTFLNAVAQSLTGWTPVEAASVSIEVVVQVINETSRKPIENPAARALREGSTVGLANHSMLIARDGTERSIEDSASPIRNVEGAIVGVVLVFRDCTERRRQERASREALCFAREIVATLREPFLILDRDLLVKSANTSFYRVFQTSEQETTGRFLYNLGGGQWNIPVLRTLLQEALPAEIAVHDFEVEHDIPEIGRRIMLLNARRFPPEGENRDADLAVHPGRHRTEEVNRRAPGFRTPVPAALSDGQGRNSDPRRRPRDDHRGQSVHVRVAGLRAQRFPGQATLGDRPVQRQGSQPGRLRRPEREGVRSLRTLPLKTKRGDEVEVEFVSNRYMVGDREVAQCNIRDITQRSRMERQAKAQAAALADLHRRKDEFLAMLSHELRNPLSPILNAVHLLRLQGNENLIQQEARRIIERQVGQLSHLVDDLLEVARFATGKIRLNPLRIDMKSVVERAVESARPLIDAHRHQLSVTLPAEPILLDADPMRLEQVVVNLLNNAAKYTDDGGLIRLDAQTVGHEMVLKVRDTGVGIDLERFPDIFDLFTAGRSVARPVAGGARNRALARATAGRHALGDGRGPQ